MWLRPPFTTRISQWWLKRSHRRPDPLILFRITVDVLDGSFEELDEFQRQRIADWQRDSMMCTWVWSSHINYHTKCMC